MESMQLNVHTETATWPFLDAPFYMVAIESIVQKGDIGAEKSVDFIFDGIADIYNELTSLYGANTLQLMYEALSNDSIIGRSSSQWYSSAGERFDNWTFKAGSD